ncbi:MAG: hypothetical protein M3P50_01735, partial [Actinomycetota bacterium]|nr:hypothetical protein [Actinomycetota bacterium]
DGDGRPRGDDGGSGRSGDDGGRPQSAVPDVRDLLEDLLGPAPQAPPVPNLPGTPRVPGTDELPDASLPGASRDSVLDYLFGR